MTIMETDRILTIPDIAKSKIKITESSDQISVYIPPKGVRGGAMVTIIVIALWMFTILVWSVLLGMMKPLNILYSLPFWAIGVWTLMKALKMIRLNQEVIISSGYVILKVSMGSKNEERQFERGEVKINFIEGSYYDYTGLNKRGQFPAIIYKGEAFSFAERSSIQEKKWLVKYLNDKLNNQ